MSIIFLRVGWMEHYRGPVDDLPVEGGSYNEENTGGEVFNFQEFKGSMYGYVHPTGPHIDITKLGAAAADDHVDGVLAVWVAKNPKRRSYIHRISAGIRRSDACATTHA